MIEQKSPHSYIEKHDGVSRHLHADKLRKYHVIVQEISARPLQGHTEVNETKVEHCAIIYEEDKDFGEVEVTDTPPAMPELLPSQKTDSDKLKHVSLQQKKELLSILDKYPECFSGKPGLCTMVIQPVKTVQIHMLMTPQFFQMRGHNM